MYYTAFNMKTLMLLQYASSISSPKQVDVVANLSNLRVNHKILLQLETILLKCLLGLRYICGYEIIVYYLILR